MQFYSCIYFDQVVLISFIENKQNQLPKLFFLKPISKYTTDWTPPFSWFERGGVSFSNLSSTLHWYVLFTFIHIFESSLIYPRQKYFISLQPPPASSNSIFLSKLKKRIQSSQECLCFQAKEVFGLSVYGWVWKGGGGMRKALLQPI